MGEQARFGVIRLSRDLSNPSWLGMIYTHRDFMESSNDVGGIDGRFKFGDNWSTDFQAVYSTRTTDEGESLSDPAYRLHVARNGRKVNTDLNYRDFGLEFVTDTVSGDLTLTFRPLRNLVNENLLLVSRLDDAASGGPVFRNQIIRSQWNWQFSVELSLRAILRYDETEANPELTSLENTKNFNADFLLTYLVHPGTAVYVGYNSNYQNLDLIRPPEGHRGETLLSRTENDLFNDARGLFVKISYLFRL